MNFFLFKKILIIFFLLIFSISVNAQIFLEKIDLADMVVEYPEEVLIERGWISPYFSVSVNNTGDSDLYNVVVFVEGKHSDWFEFRNNESSVIQREEKIEFVSKISVPYETPVESYDFSLNINSDEINYKTDFTVRVFASREDLLLYEVQVLKSDLNELESEANKIEVGGLNLSGVRNIFYEIRLALDLVEDQILNKMYNQVTESMREIEKLFIKARFEVENPSQLLFGDFEEEGLTEKDFLLYLAGIGIIILSTSLILLVRKVKRENKVRLPNLRLKERLIENRKLKEIELEIGKTIKSQELIEDEYRQKMISRESYKELRLKYQEKLLELEAKRKKLRGY